MEFLLNSSLRNANQVAIKTNTYSITYKELDEKITRYQKYLKNQGIVPGKIVPFLAKEDLASITILFALFRMGAIALPMNRKLSKVQRAKVYKYISNETIFIPKSACLCLQTSGSSGNPKMVLLSYTNLYYGALGSINRLQLGCDNLYLLSLPLHHIAGIIILFRVFLAKATIVLPCNNVLHQIQTQNITHLSLVPTQLYRILQECLHNPIPSVTHLLVGGSSIPHYLHKKIRELQVPVLFSYGMTEMSSTIAMGSDIEELHILPHRKVAISNEKEILVQGRCLFLGYLGRDPIHLDSQQGWFSTKDIGTLAPEKSLRISGRKDRMFISAGENIHPEMIETAICTILDVQIAIVVTVPDKEYGRRPVAFIRTKRVWTESQYIKRLRLHLSSLFLPIRLFSLPKMQFESLKINYTSLQKIACNSLGITMDSA